MLKHNTARKGVVLLIVLATILVVIILAGIILNIVSSQSRLTTHQVSRIKAYYAGRGIMNYALDMLRQGNWTASGSVNKTACLGNCTGLGVAAPDYTIPTDSDIPYNILVTIYHLNTAINNTTTQLSIKTDYAYTP